MTDELTGSQRRSILLCLAAGVMARHERENIGVVALAFTTLSI